MSIEDDIRTQFPPLYNLYHNIPEVWAILIMAATAHTAPQEVQAAIQNSTYWKTRTDNQRAWDATLATDPAQAQRVLSVARDAVVKNAVRLGLQLDQAQIEWFTVNAAQFNWQAPELNDAMVAHAATIPVAQQRPGEFGAAVTQVRKIADDYAMPVGDKEVVGMAADLLSKSGASPATEDSLRDTFAKRAASLYPGLADELAHGTTVKQWAQPYVDLAAKQLEISPETINLGDPKWRTILEGARTAKPDKPGQPTFTPMTLSEWQQTFRTDPRYGYDKTIGARDQASQLVTQLLQKFGATG